MMKRLAAVERTAPAIDTPVPVAAGRLTVEIRRDLDLDAADAAAMDALVAARPHVGVFVSRGWLSGLFRGAPQ